VVRTLDEGARRDGAKPDSSVAVTAEVLLIIAPSGELLFSRELGNKGIAGVAILNTDKAGRSEKPRKPSPHADNGTQDTESLCKCKGARVVRRTSFRFGFLLTTGNVHMQTGSVVVTCEEMC
jgi:hypothetical protein